MKATLLFMAFFAVLLLVQGQQFSFFRRGFGFESSTSTCPRDAVSVVDYKTRCSRGHAVRGAPDHPEAGEARCKVAPKVECRLDDEFPFLEPEIESESLPDGFTDVQAADEALETPSNNEDGLFNEVPSNDEDASFNEDVFLLSFDVDKLNSQTTDDDVQFFKIV